MLRVAVVLALAGCRYNSPMVGGDDATIGSEEVPPDQELRGRITDALESVWKFDEGTGTMVMDSGPAQPPINLTVSGTSMVTWVTGGLRVDQRSLIQSPPAHLNSDCRTAGGCSLEAWVTPADTEQGSANYAIVGSVSVNPLARNLTLAQVGDRWSGQVRTSSATTGDPAILSDPATVEQQVTHLVLVANATERVLYVNGRPYLSVPEGNGDLTPWDSAYPLNVGDEDNGYDRHWTGTLWFMAVYKKALTRLEVMSNFNTGYDCSDC